jgi:2-oxoglutarate ferredoxin oxidoreductase subunit alpha
MGVDHHVPDKALNLLIGGEAGQGLATIGLILAKSLVRAGYSVVVTQDYESRIRGGHNTFAIRAGTTPILAPQEPVDLIVALNAETVERHQGDLSERGAIITGESFATDGKPCLAVPLKELASKRYVNTAALGVAASVLGLEKELISQTLQDTFGAKHPEALEENRKALDNAFAWVAEQPAIIEGLPPVAEPGARRMLNGNEAIGLGALAAGLRFYAYYPMTPATSIAMTLIQHADAFGCVVEQAEDEIAAVNMVCGATYAGVPALTMTSGGGFALMAEGLSLAGILELPLVIILAQRPGPATGLPTRTAQQDLLFALHAGHGEFPRAIFAPGTPEQAYDLTRRALETAHKYQTPVLLMTDQYLADLVMVTPPLDDSVRPIDRHVAADAGEDYVRYAVTDDGISPRALPGGEAMVVVDSDVHTEDGHITEDLEAHLRLQDKRMRKLEGMRAEALAPDRYGPDDASHLLLCWGSTYGPCREAVDVLNENGDGRVAMLHFPQVWPLDPEAVKKAIGSGGNGGPETITVVEGNQTGQFRTVLAEAGVALDAESLTQYDGMPFTAAGIVERLQT